jgi:hypothetical protein
VKELKPISSFSPLDRVPVEEIDVDTIIQRGADGSGLKSSKGK